MFYISIGEDGRLHGQPCHCALFSDTLAMLSPSEPHTHLCGGCVNAFTL
jgi:hypothetical protein